MNIFERIQYRKSNSITLNRSKVTLLGSIFSNNMKNISVDKSFYNNSKPYISPEQEQQLGFNKNVSDLLATDIFSGLMQLFFGINIVQKREGFNTTSVINDFNTYFQFYDKFKGDVFKIRLFLCIGITIGLAIFFAGLYGVLFYLDFPNMFSGGIFKGGADSFAGLFAMWNAKVVTFLTFGIVLYLTLTIFNRMVKNKIFQLQKILDAYLFNTLIYHYIMNSYSSENKELQYFYYKGILTNIVDKLKKDGMINDDEYVLYIMYLEEPRDAHGLLNNAVIGELLNNYYSISKTGEADGYHLIENTITDSYELKKTNITEMLERESQTVANTSKTVMLIALYGGMGTIFATVGIIAGVMFKAING